MCGKERTAKRRTNRELKRDAASRTLQFEAIRNNKLVVGELYGTGDARERKSE